MKGRLFTGSFSTWWGSRRFHEDSPCQDSRSKICLASIRASGWPLCQKKHIRKVALYKMSVMSVASRKSGAQREQAEIRLLTGRLARSSWSFAGKTSLHARRGPANGVIERATNCKSAWRRRNCFLARSAPKVSIAQIGMPKRLAFGKEGAYAGMLAAVLRR